MNRRHARLFPGDLVEVKAPDDILKTLDAAGTLDHLPFMPEMIEFCGRPFRVSRRVVKTCVSGAVSGMREFRNDDVVTLDGVRCSGQAHDGCQKACMVFWREAWLRKVEDASVQNQPDFGGSERLRACLTTTTGPKTYFCQASELLKATNHLSHRRRLGKAISEVRAGNVSVPRMALQLGIWFFWRTRRTLLGEYGRGHNTSTPAESLNLQPDELVEVKPMAQIVETLDERARNRGLYFTPGMRLSPGGQYRVKCRLDKAISDGTGEMRQFRNTVCLEGSLCGCAYTAFGGCPRNEFNYWREIWLQRSGNGK